MNEDNNKILQRKLAEVTAELLGDNMTMGEFAEIGDELQEETDKGKLLEIIFSDARHVRGKNRGEEETAHELPPNIDPYSTSFDQAAFAEEYNKPGFFQLLAHELEEKIRQTIVKITSGEDYAALKKIFYDFNQTLENNPEIIEILVKELRQKPDTAKDTAFYLWQVKGGMDNPEEAGDAILELIKNGFDKEGKPQGEFAELVNARRDERRKLIAARNRFKKKTIYEQSKENGSANKKISYKEPQEFKASTTKTTRAFFSPTLFSRDNVDGQIQIVPIGYGQNDIAPFVTVSYQSNKELLQKKYGITNFDFSGFDFFLSTLLDNMKENDTREVTFSKIFKELYNREPNSHDMEEIEKYIAKGFYTDVTINLEQLAEAWSVPIKKEIHSHALNVKFETVTNKEELINGGLSVQHIGDAEKVIITDYSPFYELSEAIKQYATWDRNLLKYYKGTRTQRYFNLLFYLLGQIAWLRGGGNIERADKLKMDSIYKYMKDRNSKEKGRTFELTKKLLDDVFIKTGDILSYKVSEDKSTLYLKIAKLIKDKKK